MIADYIHIDPGDIKLHLERQDDLDVQEVKIEFPEAKRSAAKSALVQAASKKGDSLKKYPAERLCYVLNSRLRTCLLGCRHF